MLEDRSEAGRKLAQLVKQRCGNVVGLVLSIPRGGVVVGIEVVRKLSWEHRVLVAKKIGMPGNEELAMGAIAEDGAPILDVEMIGRYGLEPEEVEEQIERTRVKIRDYISKFRWDEEIRLNDKRKILLVDDGIATGETVKAALSWLRLKLGSRLGEMVVVGVGVGSKETVGELRQMVEMVCVEELEWMAAVGQGYRHFEQVSDEEVARLLS